MSEYNAKLIDLTNDVGETIEEKSALIMKLNARTAGAGFFNNQEQEKKENFGKIIEAFDNAKQNVKMIKDELGIDSKVENTAVASFSPARVSNSEEEEVNSTFYREQP